MLYIKIEIKHVIGNVKTIEYLSKIKGCTWFYKTLIIAFWPQALFIGPKRSFVVIVVLLIVFGMLIWAKKCFKWKKNIREKMGSKSSKKMLQKKQKRFAVKIASTWTESHKLKWQNHRFMFARPSVALIERPILFCGLFLLLWYYMALHGFLWSVMVFYGLAWP